RQARAGVRAEREDARRVLRLHRERRAPGNAWRRAHRRRSRAPRGDPGARLPFRGVEGGDLYRAPRRFRPLLRRRDGRAAGNGKGIARRARRRMDHGDAARASPGAGGVRGVRPLPAVRPRPRALLEAHMRTHMAIALNVIKDEHRSIAAVLLGMQELVHRIRDRGGKIDTRVFRAMLYYLDTFSERMHHPKEDQYLFAPLRRLGASSNALIAQLEREHAQGENALRRVEQCLIRYEEGGKKEFPEFASE